MRRDDDHLEAVDLLKLVSLGIRRSRHARQVVVQTEIILERNGRDRLVLVLDGHAFLRLDRLVQAVGPAAARHRAPGELVDDDDLAVLDDIVDITLVDRMRPQLV